MKKAKLMLAAIAVFAVVGGAYAFKAQRGAVIFCHPTTTTLGTELDNFTTTLSTVPGAYRAYCTVNAVPITKSTWITTLN